ncbi:MAG: Nitrogen permease regulator 2 [Bogoriella megaspora]|nr:MAG: Nitrogen permease regulator 2 [Bogoriella megaspora]
MIKAIFLTRFHSGKGPVVVYQVPDGSIKPSTVPPHPSLTVNPPLFDFSLISEYLIPRQEFCDRLVTICVNHNRIIGYPVCITDERKYDRNEFIFNFAVVMDERENSAAWETVIRKLARLMRSLEEQSGFLSQDEAEREDKDEVSEAEHLEKMTESTILEQSNSSRVYALCEMIMEDLNNYSECMIPIDQSNTLNLKLFPPRLPPPPVHGWHVPLATVRLSSLQSSTWDLTISQIIPCINGINSVTLISQIADVDFTLTRKAIQHLLYYNCILLLDIFQFSAIYAPTPAIALFLTDDAMQEECRRYVTTPEESNVPESSIHRSNSPDSPTNPHRSISSSITSPSPQRISSIPQTGRPFEASMGGRSSTYTTTHSAPPSLSTLIDLYTSLKQGLTLRSWCEENSIKLTRIDIRRFITFGVIKGFLYRVHKYAIAATNGSPTKQNAPQLVVERVGEGRHRAGTSSKRDRDQDPFRKAAMSSGWATPRGNTPSETGRGGTSGITTGLRSMGLRKDGEREREREVVNGEGSFKDGDDGGSFGGSVGRNGEGSPEKRDELPLARYLDGMHCFDEICSDLGMGEREMLRKLRGYEEVFVVHR